MAYLSPRKGIKVLVEHNNRDPSHHTELYDAVAAHFKVSVPADSKCRDISRSNFICYDPEAYFYPGSTVFDFTPSSVGKEIALSPFASLPKWTTDKLVQHYQIVEIPPILTERKEINKVLRTTQKWANKKFPITKGSRNANLFRFACVLHDHGVTQKDALTYLTLKYVAPDFLGAEIETIIRNAYK